MKPTEKHGFFRAAIATPELRVADVEFNVHAIMDCLADAESSSARIVVFHELSITGHSCGDLFHSRQLIDSALDGLVRVAETTAYEPVTAIVGLPLEVKGRLYNVAALVNRGDILGIVPKTYLPNTHEFYDNRWFTSATQLDVEHISFGTETIPIGTDLLFKFENLADCIIGIEICEDLWTVEPPSGQQAIAGASVLANLSASNELIGKAEYRRELVSSNPPAASLLTFMPRAALVNPARISSTRVME